MLQGSYLKQEPELMQRTILEELQLNLEPLLVKEKKGTLFKCLVILALKR